MQPDFTCRRCGAVYPAGPVLPAGAVFPAGGVFPAGAVFPAGDVLPDAEKPCPRCVLELAVELPEPPADEVATSAPRIEMVTPGIDELRAVFPDLEIESLIGQGGMGAVFRARQRKLDRVVALKVLPREMSADRGFADRFLREARALARLSHPSIVGVHEYGETEGICWLALEYVDGVNLRALLRDGSMDSRQALAIVRELCDALQYAHDEGIVHRDIKPENVLVDRRGRAKVADFGLAKLVGAARDVSLTREGQVMGTPHYMAPEQIERPREVDHRADIYALGVVFYEMLTGSLPRGKFEPPSRRVQVDVRLDEIVLKALEHEPSRRYQHAVDVKTDVDLVGDGARAAATPDDAFDVRANLGPAGVHVVASRDLFRGWRGFVLILVCWIALGASWNLGPFVFGLASVIAVLLGGLLVRGRLLARPELAAALAAESPSRRKSRILQSAVLGVVGLGIVALGHVAHWEQGIRAWVPAWRGTDGLLANLRANVWSLMPADTAGAALAQPRLELSHAAVSGNAGEGIPIPGIWIILIGFVVLGFAVHAAVRASERADLGKASLTIASELGTQIGLGLLVLWIGAPIAALRSESKLDAVFLDALVDAPVDEVFGHLRVAYAREGLVVDVEQIGQVVDERTREQYADVLVLRGASGSPFERWVTTWSGAERRTPQIWISAVCPRDSASTEIRLNAGLYPPDSAEARDALEVLRSIVSWVVASS